MQAESEQVCSYQEEWRLPCRQQSSEAQVRRGVVSSIRPKESGDASNFRLTLLEDSWSEQILLVFLRQIGCTFAKQTLNDLAKALPELLSEDVRVIVVHMSSLDSGTALLKRFGLESLEQVSNPTAELYSEFGIPKGNIFQILGLRVIIKGLWVALTRGLGIGYDGGDCFQMPGVLVLSEGKVVREFKYRDVSQRLSFVDQIRKR